ncbi:hypothetical protein K3495_g4084 [Podosphaera aphanis]|nr:hypothetical protein K3495_g4084 [Podosphaera aphanis]
MPPRKHKLDEDDEYDSASLTAPKSKIVKIKVVKPKAEKKPKTEKLKREKVVEGKKSEPVPKIGKDGKEKIITVNGQEAMDMIINYLKEQNRPYSATEISANLHGKVAKTAADKLLKELSESGKINAKSTKGNEKGSQWVFWTLQDAADNASPEELAQIDDRIKIIKESIPSLKLKLKEATKTLADIRSAPTTVALIQNIQRLRHEIDKKKEKLQSYRTCGGIKVTKDDMLRVEKDLRYWTHKRAARKGAFQALEDLMLENKPKEELWQEAGIEEDTY